MTLLPDISPSEVAERLRKSAFLQGKLIRQRLSPRSGPARTLFVSGVQRSGTNMLMNILEASYETDVFHESDPRAFDHYIMRERPIIQALVTASSASVVVVKALHEGHRVKALLDDFEPARAFWMIRYFEDAVNSMLKRWPGIRNMIDEIVLDRKSGGWRGLGMSDETHLMLRAHYRPELNDATANALFWWYRNQLFFDQRLERDPRVLPLEYESLVSSPGIHVERIAAFTGIHATARMRNVSHTESVRKSPPPEIAPDVHALCVSMQKRLQSAARNAEAKAPLAAGA